MRWSKSKVGTDRYHRSPSTVRRRSSTDHGHPRRDQGDSHSAVRGGLGSLAPLLYRLDAAASASALLWRISSTDGRTWCRIQFMPRLPSTKLSTSTSAE